MNNEPTDASIEAVLRVPSTEQWRALWEAVKELEEGRTHSRWGGGEQVGTSVVDGIEQPVTQMPYMIYSAAVEKIMQCLYGMGLVVPFDWPAWKGGQRYRGGIGLEDAPVADVVRLLTSIVRADRFCEGTVAAAIDDGSVIAALRRLRRWADEEQGLR